MTPLPWTSRTFHFDFPLGLYPAILERVRGTPARLEELVSTFPQRVLTVKMNAGWSIQEHAGHLHDLDALHMGRLDDYRSRLPVLRAADMSNKRTFEAHHNAAEMQDILARFRSDRMRFVQQLERLDDGLIAARAMHPRLKVEMRLVDMVYFVAEHDDHHLASMHRIAQTART